MTPVAQLSRAEDHKSYGIANGCKSSPGGPIIIDKPRIILGFFIS